MLYPTNEYEFVFIYTWSILNLLFYYDFLWVRHEVTITLLCVSIRYVQSPCMVTSYMREDDDPFSAMPCDVKDSVMIPSPMDITMFMG